MRKLFTSRRSKGVLAAVSAGALLLTGSTFALWSSQSNVQGGTIISGNLDLSVEALEAWDISGPGPVDNDSFRGDQTEDLDTLYAGCGYAGGEKGHALPLGDWNAVPQDAWVFVVPLKIALQGDNMIAKLSVTLPDMLYDPDILAGDPELLITTAVGDAEYTMTNDVAEAYFQSTAQPAGQWPDDDLYPPGATNPIPVISTVAIDSTTLSNVCVVIKGQFADQFNRDNTETEIFSVGAVQDLIDINLEQVRDVGHFAP
ncbi:MAG: SipW-dependent-type signal peptide-containing protein [Micrococcales bacterium]|nr:SipW-dependent-type signal peptide-containing protein [Micrococcales bacterium]